MVRKKSYAIIWDRNTLDQFKEILDFLSKQSSQAPKIVKDAILYRLKVVSNNPLIFGIDQLKYNSAKEFRAFVIYSYRITYQINVATKEIRIIRIRHTSREPLGY